MNKTELINYLINQRNCKRYLEIGVHAERHNFVHIRCAHKINVAPHSGNANGATYQTFFDNNKQEFDIIFIDGIHTEQQTLKDISNALSNLSKGGIIVLHDCMPPDAWHQREPEEFREGENWNGTVWKAALRVFNESGYKCSLLDTDWGCGLIDTAKSQLPLQKELPQELNYQLHYKWLLEYKISVAAYLRDQVKVFYHLACMGNWEHVFEEQVFQLQGNGYEGLNMTLLGSDKDLQIAKSICSKANMKVNIIFHRPELTFFETPACLAIEEYAQQNKGYVLYLHSKGVSNPDDITKAKWRRLMMRELVENWEYCTLQLPYYDIVGVNWREMPPVSHFCGNFWYASTKYLSALPDFKYYYENPHYRITDTINEKRLGCEFWIGSGKGKPNLLSLFCRNVDFCNKDYWKGQFRTEKTKKNRI